jgi:hypothetical protein
MLCPDANPGRLGEKPTINRLSCGTAWTPAIFFVVFLILSRNMP